MKRISLLALFLAMTQTACIAVGYSNRGGWFLWPGGLGLLVVVLLGAGRRYYVAEGKPGSVTVVS